MLSGTINTRPPQILTHRTRLSHLPNTRWTWTTYFSLLESAYQVSCFIILDEAEFSNSRVRQAISEHWKQLHDLNDPNLFQTSKKKKEEKKITKCTFKVFSSSGLSMLPNMVHWGVLSPHCSNCTKINSPFKTWQKKVKRTDNIHTGKEVDTSTVAQSYLFHSSLTRLKTETISQNIMQLIKFRRCSEFIPKLQWQETPEHGG